MRLRNTGKHNPVAVAGELWAVTGDGWRGLQRKTVEELAELPGMTRGNAVVLKAALELGRRMLLAAPGERLQIRSPADAAHLLMAEMSALDQEHFRVLCLDTVPTRRRLVELLSIPTATIKSTHRRFS